MLAEEAKLLAQLPARLTDVADLALILRRQSKLLRRAFEAARPGQLGTPGFSLLIDLYGDELRKAAGAFVYLEIAGRGDDDCTVTVVEQLREGEEEDVDAGRRLRSDVEGRFAERPETTITLDDFFAVTDEDDDFLNAYNEAIEQPDETRASVVLLRSILTDGFALPQEKFDEIVFLGALANSACKYLFFGLPQLLLDVTMRVTAALPFRLDDPFAAVAIPGGGIHPPRRPDGRSPYLTKTILKFIDDRPEIVPSFEEGEQLAELGLRLDGAVANLFAISVAALGRAEGRRRGEEMAADRFRITDAMTTSDLAASRYRAAAGLAAYACPALETVFAEMNADPSLSDEVGAGKGRDIAAGLRAIRLALGKDPEPEETREELIARVQERGAALAYATAERLPAGHPYRFEAGADVPFPIAVAFCANGEETYEAHFSDDPETYRHVGDRVAYHDGVAAALVPARELYLPADVVAVLPRRDRTPIVERFQRRFRTHEVGNFVVLLGEMPTTPEGLN